MKSYNECLKENSKYTPYTDEELENVKEYEEINPIRFKRLIATIDKMKGDNK